MENIEFLLTSSQSSLQFSACLWDYKTKNIRKLYKSGGTIAPKTLVVLGQDYVLSAEFARPILHLWPLNSQLQAKNIRLILPEQATCLTVCPKNTYLAVGISNKLYIWQISSGKLLSVQQKNYQPITCIKFSSDSGYVVIGGEDGILIVYNLGDLVNEYNNLATESQIGHIEPVYTKNDHSMPIRDLHVGTFGRKSRIATASADQTCRIYNLSSGEVLLVLVFDEPLTTVIFDSPCWQLFVGTNGGNIKQFGLKNPPRTLSHHIDDKCTKSFVGHKKKIVCMALNLSNCILASGSDDNFVFTWEVRSRQILQKFDHKSCITNIKFVLAYSNFFTEIFKPKIEFKNLERSCYDVNNDDLVVSLIQTNDIDLSDDENSLEKEKTREELMIENRKLRVNNLQLYKAALEISKKYNTNG